MKRLNILLGLVACLFSSCTNLEETVYSGVAVKDFFTNETELISNAGRAYTQLQGYTTEQSLWTLHLQASDECAVPACGGSWYSNGRYEEVQQNNIPASNTLLKNGWNWIFDGIASCNEIIYITEQSEIEFDGKASIIAEIKILRAMYYYQAMSSWGNIPFVIDYEDIDYPEQKGREYVFSFLETEILENVSLLDEEPTTSNYGRANQAMAYAILAKMYLNSEVWFGEARYDDAEEMCAKIIGMGHYSIVSDYAAPFHYENDNCAENIFVIPYDRVYTYGYDNAFYLHTLTLEAASIATFNITASPWSGFICQPDFFQTYDEADLRRSESWLYGEQYDISGASLGFEYTAVFDDYYYYNSNGGRGDYDGARCWKWHYQTDGSITNYKVSMDNDFVLFRYADVVLMYAEALIRQNRISEAVAITELTQIRERAGLAAYTTSTLTLEELYDERGRELAWEGWRHEDMIRFGTYLEAYWAHPDISSYTYRNLFPIPTDALNANPNLVQNESY